jgi:hypothetical protein
MKTTPPPQPGSLEREGPRLASRDPSDLRSIQPVQFRYVVVHDIVEFLVGQALPMFL